MDHISLPVRNVAETRRFYLSPLAALHWRVSGFQEGRYAAFKRQGSPPLYFHQSHQVGPVHLAFRALSQAEVVAFHAAGLAAGGRDNGAPGPRPAYGQTYFAAFLFDPDGHNIEAVCGGVGPR